MKHRVVLALALFAPLAGAAEPPPSIKNARIESQAGLTPSDALKRSGIAGEAEWVGWSAPAVPRTGEICCFTKGLRRRACSLSDRDWSWGSSDESPRSDALIVLVKSEKGRPIGVRIVSPTCEIEGAGQRLLWLGQVDSGASLAALDRLLDAGARDDVAEPALGAVAHHADPRADAILERRALDRSLDREARKQAVFWAGNARGESGYRLLDRLLGSERDADLREHALFALTQTAPQAIDRVKRAAVEDRDGSVRGQALFWLAQAHAPGAGEWIVDRLDAEEDDQVREQAVFALSQLEDGTDWLLKLLRSKRDPEIVRRALFWLGQSDDPRALEEIEKILDR